MMDSIGPMNLEVLELTSADPNISSDSFHQLQAFQILVPVSTEHSNQVLESISLPGGDSSKMILLQPENFLIPYTESLPTDNDSGFAQMVEPETMNNGEIQEALGIPEHTEPVVRRLLNLDLLPESDTNRRQRYVNGKKRTFMPRCETCDELLKSVSQFKAHSRKCRHMKQFICNKCGESFNQKLNHELHMAIHAPRSNSQMVCPACNKSFTRLASFKCHLTLHRVEDSAICDICREEFPYYTQLKRHVRVCHINGNGDGAEETYMFCRECGLVLETDQDLKSHRLTHKKIRETMRLSSKKRKTVSVKGGKGRRPGQIYQCTQMDCKKVLSSHSALQRHMRIHTNQKPYECSVCGKKFNQKGSLMFHEAIHLKEKPYSCQLCGMGFTQRGNLRKHVERLHPVNVADRPAYRCSFCPCIFKAIQPLNVHLSKQHQEAPDLQDQSTSDLLKDAIAESGIDHGPSLVMDSSGTLTSIVGASSERIRKDRSGKQLAAISQKLLKRATVELLKENLHSNKKTQTQTQKALPLGDSLCGPEAKGVRVIVEDGNRKRWVCPHCGRKVTRASDMARHLRIHSGERPYTCDWCGSSYPLRSTLQQHLRTHLGNVGEKCPVCFKTLATRNALRNHIKRHNNRRSDSKKKLETELEQEANTTEQLICSAPESIEKSFADPLMQINTGELVSVPSRSAKIPDPQRTNRCDLCDAAFKRATHLKDHIKTAHGDGKKYNCRQCGMWFLTSRYLRDHVKRHIGRKPFSCPLCSKSFVTKGQLNRHSQVHTEERPFICPYCVKTFKNGVKCRLHIKTVHKESALPPPRQMIAQCMGPYVSVPDAFEHENNAEALAQTSFCNDFGVADISVGNWVSEEPRSQQDVMLSSISTDQQPFPVIPQREGQNAQFMSTDDTIGGRDLVGAQFLDLSSVIGGVLSPGAGLCEMTEAEVAESFQERFESQPNAVNGNEPIVAYGYCSCPICRAPTSDFREYLSHLTSFHTTEAYCQFCCPVCDIVVQGVTSFCQHVHVHHGQFVGSVEENSGELKSSNEADTITIAALSSTGFNRLHQVQQVAAPSQVQQVSGFDAKEFSQNRLTVSEELGSGDNPYEEFHVNLVPNSGKAKMCQICYKSFRKANDLERHLRIHTGDKPFPCEFCGKRFRVKSTLTSHVKTHSDDIPNSSAHVCQVCNKEFMSRGSLKVHLRIHTNEKPFSCEHCGENFRTSSGKKSHLEKEHSTNGKLSKQLRVHRAENLETVLAGNPQSIPSQSRVELGKSETSAFNRVAAKEHPSEEGADNVPTVQRLSLSVKPDSNGTLQVEVRPLPVGCQLRGVPGSEVIIEVATLQELVNQGMVLNIPLGSNSSSVSQVTVDPVYLLESLQQEGMTLSAEEKPSNKQGTGLFNESYSDLCDMLYDNDPGEKFIVECKICEVNFRTPAESAAHFQSEDHETALFTAGHVRSDRKYPCQYCVKAFEHRWKLDRHIRIHSRIRPFVCPHCSKTFNQRSAMQKHIDGVHLNKRNFLCETCGRSFQHKWNLTRHWKTVRACGVNVGGAGDGPVVMVQPQWEDNGVEKSLLLSL